MKIRRNKTYVAKKADIKRKWYLFDAKGKVLGRLAVKIANVLRGKNKPDFTPHLDTGDAVIVINASNLKVTGRKAEQKLYQRFSGFPSGLKEVTFSQMIDKKPQVVIKEAVKNMLPDNKLKRLYLKRLKIYKDTAHLHASQNPTLLEV